MKKIILILMVQIAIQFNAYSGEVKNIRVKAKEVVDIEYTIEDVKGYKIDEIGKYRGWVQVMDSVSMPNPYFESQLKITSIGISPNLYNPMHYGNGCGFGFGGVWGMDKEVLTQDIKISASVSNSVYEALGSSKSAVESAKASLKKCLKFFLENNFDEEGKLLVTYDFALLKEREF
ncbi:MAG: hypothetical protein HOO06_09045 [Bdellovibrionaceae bacterium]|jgi:hypothetical protein|nr:hypothetical protein [Pseudobdellovibrionaceae bacterium]